MKKKMIVIYPYCGYKIRTPCEWYYESYNQQCPECEGYFDFSDDLVEEDKDGE